jgi:hypothetical protein
MTLLAQFSRYDALLDLVADLVIEEIEMEAAAKDDHAAEAELSAAQDAT